ncbi:MAG: hypothetical protein LYZ66_04805 [Nitrososphaerales archaeon]|nr:hypothetical protein [Nitrososphaerales archaeon]
MIPRSLGASAPKGTNVYEIFLVVDNKPSVLAKVSDVFGNHLVNMLGIHGQNSDDGKTGYILVYAEMAGAKSSVDELLESLRKTKSVREARADSMTRVRFERMMFPLTGGGHHRVFLMGAEEWKGLVGSIGKLLGESAASSLMHQEGVSVGEGLVKRIESSFSEEPDTQTLVDNAKSAFQSSGFGILEVNGSKEALSVGIQHPIVGVTGPVDNFTIGIVVGMFQKIHRASYHVDGVEYGGDGMLKFKLVES